ncbi:ANTAR domain-containing protein [Streptomyces sp. NPDC056486]|uniref:ANTAR domain-containing protein n=1 Tax=Streptomyces sp. NPDC056486 TaxID=3345835 RepID=UPI0036AB0CBC
MTERALPAQLAQDSEVAPGGEVAPDNDVEQDPRARCELDPSVELGQLRRAMQTRPVIDMARGVLMASFGLSAEDAWEVLVSVSQNTNTKLHVVADELVGAVTGGEISKPFRRKLAATVAQLHWSPAAPGADEGSCGAADEA